MDMSLENLISELETDEQCNYFEQEMNPVDQFDDYINEYNKLLVTPPEENIDHDQYPNFLSSLGFEKWENNNALDPKYDEASNGDTSNNNNNNNNNCSFSICDGTTTSNCGSDPKDNNKKNSTRARANNVGGARTPSEVQDRVMAERLRREKLAQRFVALSAIIPGLKKIDKSSILGDAIDYMKQLKEYVKSLELRINESSVESATFVNKSHELSGDNNSEGLFEEGLSQLEVRISGKDVLIRIHCKKRKGLVMKLFSEIEKLNLEVVNSCVMPFGIAINMTIVAQMDGDLGMPVNDLVRKLSSSL